MSSFNKHITAQYYENIHNEFIKTQNIMRPVTNKSRLKTLFLELLHDGFRIFQTNQKQPEIQIEVYSRQENKSFLTELIKFITKCRKIRLE